MSPHSSRAGTTVRQRAGYRAFIPAPLPPDPPLNLANLRERLSRADRALVRLDGAVHTLPHPDPFVFMCMRKEAVHSSQIEGIQASLQPLLAAEAGIQGRQRQAADIREALNCLEAMHFGLEHLPEQPISVHLIRETHARLMAGTRDRRVTPGELRTRQNWIGPAGCSPHTASFVPPPPEQVPGLLADLAHFLQQERALPPLIRIGLAHAQFETIHPFLDGNGRVGRLLIIFLLSRQQRLSRPVLYLSSWFLRHRQAYYDHLQAVRDHGDWEGWLAFFLDGIIETGTQAAEKARQLLLMREAHEKVIMENLGYAAGKGYQVLDTLLSQPVVSVKDIRAITGTTYAAANELVKRLQNLGLLEEITGQARNRRFHYAPYICLFASD